MRDTKTNLFKQQQDLRQKELGAYNLKKEIADHSGDDKKDRI